MTAFAAPAGTLRHDVLRWGLCFAVAAAVHGTAVLALLPTPEESDFVAGAPVVMITLPEAPAALSNPLTDLLPGPAEPESEHTRPPKEETKPPEEIAEVALQKPEPPRLELPAEEIPATAPPSVAAAMPAAPTAGVEAEPVSDAILRWESALRAHIERFKHYPPEARARGARGSARVAFTIDRDGRLRESHIIESSGSQDLDREALAMLARAHPMPKPPGEVQTDNLSRAMTVRFK